MLLKITKKYSVRCLTISLLLFLLAPRLSAGLAVYDTPTALSLQKAQYEALTSFYAGGGTLVKLGVGINTYVNLGAIEYVDGLIGAGKTTWSIPNVYLKIRVTELPPDRYNFAFGYDSFYNGSFNPFDKKIYGLYGVFTMGFRFANEPKAHLFSTGLRYPLIYRAGQPNVFTSLLFYPATFLALATEISNLHFAKQYRYFFIQSNKITFLAFEQLSLSFVFQVALEKEAFKDNQLKKNVWRFSRNLEIVYQNFF